MPVEIRELVIKASIVGSEADKSKDLGPVSESQDREAIIADCVDQVMEILQELKER